MLVLDELQSKKQKLFQKQDECYLFEKILVTELRNFQIYQKQIDLIYTETLMQRGKENYAGKDIVILGGGDGGLLWELLKEKPKFITVLEVC